MPRQSTIKRARKAKRAGKSPSTQAGEFVREGIEDIRKGKHGARSAKQAIAIGLSKARRAGVDLPPPEKGEASEKTRKSAKRAYELGHGAAPKRKPSAKRSKATKRALEREGTAAASHEALSRHAKKSAKQRTSAGDRLPRRRPQPQRVRPDAGAHPRKQPAPALVVARR